MVAQTLFRNDARQHFAEHCESIHKGWALLLDKTTLPDNTTCTDSRVADAIRALDNNIKCPENNIHLRIAYKVRELTRLSNRWAALPGRYPFLLTTFTDVAERVINKTSITSHNLKALTEEICRACLTALIVVSDYVAKDAELAVISGSAYNPGRAQKVLAQVKKMLT
ncbi:hypothetical protein F4779DRAFT_631219 [Xylariaceae sp. FL0662B]|nr:hypothetical protein F4779DRAFT_631219 [Xylariaceae sp. FL0662B]